MTAGSISQLLIRLVAIFVVLTFLCTATSCTTQCRPATIQLTERDLRDAFGRWRTPVHAVTHEAASTQQTIYRTPSGAQMHGPVYRIRSVAEPAASEFPKLSHHASPTL